jgi:cytoskeletal protein CcmA (bactofilin family)
MGEYPVNNRIEDLIIKGSGNSAGGKYKTVNIKGSGEIDGDIECNIMKIEGGCTVYGNLEAKTVEIKGNSTIKGSCHSTDIDIQGSANFGNDVSAEEINAKGRININGNFNAEKFNMEGAFKIRGLLNAGELELKLHGPSEAREIGGEKITIKREGRLIFPRIEKMITTLGFNTCLITDVIEGDEIYLEYTKAKIIRGNNIEIGPGCEIELIEYKESYKQDEKAVVNNYKKM